MKDTRKIVKLDVTTHSYLKGISKLTHRPMTDILSELLKEIAFVACAFKKGAEIEIDSCISDSSVVIRVSGERVIAFGSFDAENEKEEVENVRKKLEKVTK